MKKKILLFISLVLIAVQGWATPVDSLKTHLTRLDSIQQCHKFERLDSLIPFDGFVRPGFNPSTLVIDDVTGSTTSSDSWSSIPSTKTFNSSVGKPVTYTFTLSYCYLTNNLDLTPHDPPKAKLNDETGMFSIDETCTYETTHPAKITDTDGFSHEYRCVHYIRKVTVTYTPNETGTHSAKLKIRHDLCLYGKIYTSYKKIDLVGTAINPSISVSPSSLTFSDATVGKTYTKTFSVTGIDLSTPMTVAWSNNQSGMFSIENTSVTNNSNRTTMIVTVAYMPTATGTHTGTITISGGGAESKTVSVKGTCTTTATPTINTSVSVFTFGTVVKGNTTKKTFTVTGSNLTGNLTVSSNNSNFTVSPTTLPASGGTVTVTYKPTAAGSHSGTITISGGGAASKNVTVTGMCVEPNITVSTSSLPFGTVVKGNTTKKTFTVTGSNLTGNLTVSSNNSNFTVSPTTLPASGGTVTVTYKPTAAGSHSGTITISGGGAASIAIRVTGTCVVPTITVSKTALAFGNVVKGKSSALSFSVTGSNLTGSLTVSSDNSNFTVNPTSISAADAAAGKIVTVTYKPTAAGSHSGTITIKGGDASSKTVSVKGTCIVPEIKTSVSSLHFAAAVSKTFKVTGTNLTGSLTVKSSNSKFTVSPSTISVSDAAAGKTVTVTYHDTDGSNNASGTITISGGGASSKTVSVTYAKGQDVQINPVYPDSGSEEGNNEFMNGGLLETSLNSTTDVNELAMNSKIYAEGLNIIIESPIEQSAVISDISGRARSVNLQAGRNEIPVNASGIYIVRIREKTTKLMLK